MRDYATSNEREDLRDEYPYFNELIEKWNIKVPNDER